MSLFPLSALTKRRISRFFKHPILIAAIASWLIPGIVERSNARAARDKARIDQALEMINTSTSVNAILNKMKTEFETFERDSLGAWPDDYRKERAELRGRINSLHREFDSIAWWWPWSVSYRARALNLISDDNFKELQSKVYEYIKNLKTTLALFKRPREIYLTADSPMRSATEPVMPELEEQFQGLQAKRDNLVRQMAALEINNPPTTDCEKEK